MTAYEDSWDRPHIAGTEPNWQESDCYWFYDRDRNIGGFHRIGRHAAASYGSVMLYAFSEHYTYLRIEDVPATRCRVTDDGHTVDRSSVRALGKGRMSFGWSESDAEAELEFGDLFYEPRNWFESARGAEIAETIQMNASGHLECSGKLRGRMRMGHEEFEVDALAHRDRSWGVRDMSLPWQHRMFSGTAGPALSFATFVMQLMDGSVHKAGFVVRNGEENDVADLRLLAIIDHDGLSVVGARAEIELENGETLDIDSRSISGFVSKPMGDLVSTDHLSTFELDGIDGFLDFEMSNNPTRGSYLAKGRELIRANAEPGLHRTSDRF